MRTLFLCLSLISLSFGYAQIDPNVFGGRTLLIRSENNGYNNYDGTPYYPQAEFSKGIMFMDGKEIPNIELRYDGYKDMVELKIKEGEIYYSNNDKNIYFLTGGQKLVWVPYTVEGKNKEGYLYCLYCGEKNKLFVKRSKVFHEAQPARTGYQEAKPPRFSDEEETYIQLAGMDHAMELPRKKKEILELFSPLSENLEALIKEHNLNLKKEADIIVLLRELEGSSLK